MLGKEVLTESRKSPEELLKEVKARLPKQRRARNWDAGIAVGYFIAFAGEGALMHAAARTSSLVTLEQQVVLGVTLAATLLTGLLCSYRMNAQIPRTEEWIADLNETISAKEKPPIVRFVTPPSVPFN